MRGEESAQYAITDGGVEIPPRARRRVGGSRVVTAHSGNTSACAEKRAWSLMAIRAIGKYLRVRGEEPRRYPIEFAPREIPPRARRRDVSSLSALYTPGNTSACAEKRVAHLRLYHQETRKSASPVDKGWQRSSLHKREFPRVMSYSQNTCNGRFALSMHSDTSKPKPKNHDHSPLILPRIFGETYNVTPRNQRASPTSRMGTAALFEVLIQQALLVAIYILGHSG